MPFLEFIIFSLLLTILTPLLGTYMYYVLTGQDFWLQSYFKPLENLSYRIAGINENAPMNAKTYTKSLLIFNAFGFLTVFLFMIFQKFLPLNPQQLPGTSFHLAFNVAASFVTNTNLQSYYPETTLSYLTQMLGLTVQNFLSAATGLSVLLVLTRGIAASEKETIGNFWQDMVRSILYIFLPLSIILACLLLAQGVIQNFSPYETVLTLEGKEQVIPMGPAASQIAIKQLGTNGGGFFNANSSHPFENPTPLTNLLENLSVLLIPAASIYLFGLMNGSKKHAWLLYAVVFAIFLLGFFFSLYGELSYSNTFDLYPVLEGKETRFGAINSILWSTATTASSNGSINAMMSSLSPIASGVAIFNMMLEELIFGGSGVGLCSLIMFVFLTVFLCGLMVGRTPEYMGKKIETKEMLWITVAILMPSSLILVGTAISSILPFATKDIITAGPHGLSTLLYAFTSASANNGSSFSNLNSNTPYYNLMLGSVMLLGRLSILIPSLMIGGYLAKKKAGIPSTGTFSTTNNLFAVLLFSVILIVSALSFFPSLALGPISEQLLMLEKRFF